MSTTFSDFSDFSDFSVKRGVNLVLAGLALIVLSIFLPTGCRSEPHTLAPNRILVPCGQKVVDVADVFFTPAGDPVSRFVTRDALPGEVPGEVNVVDAWWPETTVLLVLVEQRCPR